MAGSDGTYEYWVSVYETLKEDLKRINEQIMMKRTRLMETQDKIKKIDRRFEDMTGTGEGTVSKYRQINVEVKEIRSEIQNIMDEVSELEKDREKVKNEMRAIRRCEI